MDRRVLLLLVALTSGACAAREGVPRPFPGAALPPRAEEPATERVEAPIAPPVEEPAPEPLPAPPATASLTDVVRTALGYLGVPYLNGGSTPGGFDCSGFVQWVFGRHGTALPREVRDQYLVGEQVDFEDLKAGDLIFFETVSRGASHVGMVIGDGRFVHAPSSRGVVRVEPYTANYWARRFVGARRIDGAGVDEVSAPPTPSVFPGAIRSTK